MNIFLPPDCFSQTSKCTVYIRLYCKAKMPRTVYLWAQRNHLINVETRKCTSFPFPEIKIVENSLNKKNNNSDVKHVS